MANQSKVYAYAEVRNRNGELRKRPLLPLQLSLGYRTVEDFGLVDSGADVNVLPYHIGLELGAVWEDQPIYGTLSGNLAHYESRGITLVANISPFTPVRLPFFWTNNPDARLILGQYNFFDLFNVSFYRLQNAFEISPALR